MAQQTINLYTSRTRDEKQITLTDAVDSFVKGFGENLPEKTSAVLYAPGKCHLAILRGREFQDANGKIDTASVFEARVFNEKAEMRWLNKANGDGMAVVLCEDNTKKFFNANAVPFKPMNRELVGTIEQTYLLWGESLGPSLNPDWTRFAEARIGSFYVPVSDDKISDENKVRACFTAIEYLGVYKDGNVAVAEERLAGLEIVWS